MSVDPNRALRILVVTNLYPGGVIPARGRFVENQVDSLRALGHEVMVVSIDGARSKWEYVSGVFRVREALRRAPRDILHAHYGHSGLVAALGRRLSPRPRPPLVVSFLGSDVLWSRQRPYARWAARSADLNIVMSEEMRRVLAAPRTVVLANGTALERFRPVDPIEARHALGWAPGEFLVLFPWDPARPEKDFPLAEQAVSRVPGARLVPFSGESQERYNLALNAADVVLLTSRWEGSPNALREALAVGTPVVSVAVGDAPELLSGLPHCAVVARSAEALAERLRALAEARAAGPPIRIVARERVEPYGVAPVARRLTALYRELLRT